jgi:precorrin-6y C5,15-methyltransferase (decarboxylating), CbiE subunit/precorrin-6Y C5,15-methyltransferase (decarboxylating), CbiT subunit
MYRQRYTLIGIDDNPTPWFHPDILSIIKEGRIFSGGTRHYEIVRELLPTNSKWINITAPLDNVFNQYQSYNEIIVFASGDPLFFGFGNTIKKKLPEAEIISYPTFNSLQLLAHRITMQYDDMHTVSLTGRPWHEFDKALIEGRKKIGILTDREHTPTLIAQRMLKYGYDNYIMYIGEHLGNPQRERVSKMSINEAAEAGFNHPNNLIIVNRGNGKSRYFGIPDELFVHLNGRSKMITKAPIRLLTLSALALKDKESFWDIGFCTGSVSIEAKMQFPHLNITAFEIREEGAELMLANSRRFGTPGITTVIGDFTGIDISSFPAPDAVFIGGHGGKLKEILHKINEVLLPDGVVVFNSVSNESKKMFMEGAQATGLDIKLSTRIIVDDNNPIEIMKVINA